MRVHVVADVHGNAEALARAGDGADALLVLGDLIDYVDYADPGRGILAAVFGPDAVRRFTHLRTDGRPGELVGYVRGLWETVPDAHAVVRDAVREQYARLFAALPAPTWATPGNVDVPELWPEFAGAGVHVVDGAVAEIGGLRCGFVGGALLPEGAVRRAGGAWTPYLRTPAEFRAATQELRDLDVLCSHVPPAVPDLVYDVVARRAEVGSERLLELVHRDRPRYALFGHVHQPLARRVRIGPTECVSAGYFRRTGRPLVLHW